MTRWGLYAAAGLLAVAAGCTGAVGEAGPNGIPGQGAAGSAGAAGRAGAGAGGAGGVGATTGAAGAADACTASASLAPARVWRLTDAQYVNVVAQVFGVRVPAEVTAADTKPADFSNFSEAPELTAQSSTVIAYQKAAHAAATAAVAANLAIFLPCGKAPSDACVQGFVRNRVARAFGRLVTDAEVQDLLAMYHVGLAESPAAGVRMIIEATLQSPSFLYRTELGASTPGGPTAKAHLTPFELAAAVSFALLDSVPDDELWGHAVDGSLATASVLAKQVDRLLASPAAQANLGRQAGFWLGVEKLQSIVPKDTTLFPAWTPAVQQDLYTSARLFVQSLMGSGTMGDLLSSKRMYVNANLAKVYGIPGVTGADLQPVDVQSPGRASGIFTQPAILAAWSHPDRGDAVHRGLFVYNAFICGPTIPPPPANAQTVAATFPADATQRELAALRANNAAGCGACHGLFDPLGLATENYDPIGRYVTTDEKGQPVDSSSTLMNLGPDLDGPIAGLPDLVAKLQAGRRASDCASRNLAAIVLGRSVVTDTSCAFEDVKDHFAQTGSFADYFRAIFDVAGLRDARRGAMSKTSVKGSAMKKPPTPFAGASAHIPRRTFLAGVGTTAAGTLLRPLFAAAAGASPTRLLIVHRPCGTYPNDFFPQTGDATTFTLPSILQPFAPVKDAMTILNGVYCPRDHGWAGDQHGAGLITMMSGRRPIEIPGTSSGGDPNAKNQQASGLSFDQMMVKAPASGLGGMVVPSIQSTAYRPSSIGLPNFKVMSYDASGALFPESRPDVLFSNIFGAAMPGLSPADLERLRAQNKSILDFVAKDLGRLHGLVPRSQLPKLDAHLAGIAALEAKLTAAPTGGSTGGPVCVGPAQPTPPAQTGDLTIDEAQHQVIAQNQLAIILAAFQCDLTRVATFSFAHGNSALRFSKIIPGFDPTDVSGHHDISHQMERTDLHSLIDRFYAQQLSTVLQAMKATPDGDGTLLDHTLVVYLNECCYGWSHSIENMPLLMFGGKSLKLQTGRHIKFNMRFMNDVWAAIASVMGVPMNTYGDTAFSTGAVSGLFA